MKEDTIKNYMINNRLDVEKMIKNFNRYIHTIVENNVGNKLSNEDKEEIISDVFLTVWHNKEKIDLNRPLKYYIAGITKNIINNKLREQKKYKNQIEYNVEDIPDLTEIDIICEQDQILKVISEELNNMKAVDYKIFSKYYYYSKSIKEIAEELKISESNVSVRLHRIKKKLREKLVKKGFTYKKVLSIILILFLLTGVVFAKQIVNYVKQVIGKEESIEQIKLENPVITMTANSEIIKSYMKKYDEKMYILSIKDIEAFDDARNTLGIEFKANYGTNYINKDVFEKYKYDVILIYMEDENVWNLHSIVPYETETAITMTILEESDTKEKNQSYFILIPKEDNSENLKVKYIEEKNKIMEEPPQGATFFMSCNVKNVQAFEELNLKYTNEGNLYYTDILSSEEYYKLAEKIDLKALKDISEYGKNKEFAIIFKKTNKKIAMKRIKIEGETQIEIVETDKEYDENISISGTVIIINKGEFDTYTPYMK